MKELFQRVLVLYQHRYLFASELEPLVDKEGWFQNAVQVFDGQFTCALDKGLLVDVVTSLYAFSLLSAMLESKAFFDSVSSTHSRQQTSKMARLLARFSSTHRPSSNVVAVEEGLRETSATLSAGELMDKVVHSSPPML